MIIFMREKDFMKHKKKLVEPKDYVIGDVTDDASGDLVKFANSTSLDGLKPPKVLVNLINKDTDELDPDKLHSLEKKFIKGDEFRNTAIGLVRSEIKSDLNYFIVFKNKDFEAYGKQIIKTFKKLFPTENQIFFSLKEVLENKKILTKSLSSDDRAMLAKASDKLIKKIEEQSHKDKDKKKNKKSDKKDKDKKKKKKKKKHSQWLFID